MYRALQAGRAIAATLVVLYHLGLYMANTDYFGIEAFSVPFAFGSAGVEFFFVLSGFIILSAHRSDIFQPRKLGGYIKKRLIRIYPTYWIIFLPVFLLAITSTSLQHTVPHDIFVIVKSLLLVPQDKTVVGGTGAPVLAVAWTLQYEMFFYLFFAFMILNRWLSIIFAVAILYNYIAAQSHTFPFSFLSQDYILLFAMGMLVSLACTSKRIIVSRPLLYVYTGAVMFICVALDTVADIDSLEAWSTILYGLSSCLMIFGLVKEEDAGRVVLGGNWMQLLGDSSYALYLIHLPLMSLLCKLSLLTPLDKFGISGAIFFYFVTLSSCLLSSVAFHLRIEKPITAFLRRRLADSGAPLVKAG